LPQRRYSETRELAFKSSLVVSIANWRSSVRLVHGDDDRNAPLQQTTDLIEKCAAKKSCLRSYWPCKATADFFDRRLATAQP